MAFIAIEHIDNNSTVNCSPIMKGIQQYHVATYFEIEHYHEVHSPYYQNVNFLYKVKSLIISS